MFNEFSNNNIKNKLGEQFMENNNKKMDVYLCQGCIDLYREEYGDSLGYVVPINLHIVPVEQCDNLIMSDGRFQREHRLGEKEL